MKKVIYFKKMTKVQEQTVLSWIDAPHVAPFWDGTKEHKQDIKNFNEGRKTPSSYANGQYVYWLALMDEVPYGLLMTIKEVRPEERPPLKQRYLAQEGTTYSIEYMIGAYDYFGKGYGAITLRLFMEFFKKEVDKAVRRFFIDPDFENPRAKHVYEKAGFENVGDFSMGGHGSHAGRKTHFLIKNCS